MFTIVNSTVQDPGKILVSKGQKRVGYITRWMRGWVIYTPNVYFPKYTTFPSIGMRWHCWGYIRCSENGWINENLLIDI